MRNNDKPFLDSISAENAFSARNTTSLQTENAPDQRPAITTALYDLFSEALLLYNKEGRLTWMSAALQALFALDEQPSGQLQIYDEKRNLLSAEYGPVAQILRGQALPMSRAIKVLAHCRNGRTLPVRLCGTPLRDQQQAISGAAVIVLPEQEEREGSEQSLQLACDWMDLNELIANLANHFCTLTPHHTLHLQLAHTLPLLWADQELLSQVFSCLLSNAIKYSPPGSKISVTTAAKGHMVHVTIREPSPSHGPALREQPAPHEAAETPPALGHDSLANARFSHVYAAIYQHGGRIWIENSRHRGTTFHFTLPFPVLSLLKN